MISRSVCPALPGPPPAGVPCFVRAERRASFSQWPAAVGALVMGLLFIGLTVFVLGGGMFSFDVSLLFAIHEFETEALDRAAILVSDIGDPVIVLAVTTGLAVLLWFSRYRWRALSVFLSVGGVSGFNYFVRPLLGRARPELWVSPTPKTTFGFPSGHAITSMTLMLALVLLAWPTRWRWPVLVLGVLFVLATGLARLYLGVHYPSDIVGGWLIGAAGTLAVYAVLRPYFR